MDMQVTFDGGKRVVAHYRNHEIATDQPEKSGGQGTAPSPFDLFLASMATCAAYYVLDFCQTRALPVDGIKLLQRWERDPEEKLLTTIHQEIVLPDDFPEKYSKAVVRAAQLCSVKKHLENPPRIDVRTIRKSQVATQDSEGD